MAQIPSNLRIITSSHEGRVTEKEFSETWKVGLLENVDVKEDQTVILLN